MASTPLVSRPIAATLIRHGAVGVLATDTILGLVASALDRSAVERLYRLRGRPTRKPSIILIGRWCDLHQFDLDLTPARRRSLHHYWPGPFSLILPLTARGRKRWPHLHRGGKTLALRLPADNYFRRLLVASGPLIAPSANPEGQRPAATLLEARAYFGNQLAFYAPRRGAKSLRRPSTLIDLTGEKPRVIRS